MPKRSKSQLRAVSAPIAPRGRRNNNKSKASSTSKSQLGTPAPGQMILRGIPLFPIKYKAMLRYADSFSLTTTTGAVNTYVFSTNGLFDPNITGTGHQPVGFDQMMLSYEHYTVVNAKIGVIFANTSGNQYPTAAVSIHAGPTPITVVQQIVEDGMVVTDRLAGANTFGCVVTLRSNCNIAKYGGVRDILDDPSYQGSIIANPVEQSYFHIQTWDTSLGTANVQCEVVIEYEAWFTEPRTLTQSIQTTLRRLILSETKQ